MKFIKALLIFVALAVPFGVFAANAPSKTPSKPNKPNMVILPEDLVSGFANWAYHAGVPALYMDALRACLTDNPHNGVIVRHGPDACVSVTNALQDKEAINQRVTEWEKVASAYSDQIQSLRAENAKLRKAVPHTETGTVNLNLR